MHIIYENTSFTLKKKFGKNQTFFSGSDKAFHLAAVSLPNPAIDVLLILTELLAALSFKNSAYGPSLGTAILKYNKKI